ncbi:MAG: transposase [Bacteroidetes bacterium]|nr:transposase [Bacteroidota bacterium]
MFYWKNEGELLVGEIFYSIREAQVIIEQWSCHHNQTSPHSSLSDKPPTPAAFIPTLHNFSLLV